MKISLFESMGKLIAAFALLVSFSVLLYTEEDPIPPASTNAIGREDVSNRLGPLEFGLMGDNIDPQSGAVVFSVTDVSIHGNSDLEVEITRTTGSWSYTNREEHYLADWKLEIPSVSMYTRASLNCANNRCSKTQSNPAETSGTYGATSSGISDMPFGDIYGDFNEAYYWEGLNVNIPGEGAKLALENFRDSGNELFAQPRWSPFQWRELSYGKDDTDVSRVTTDNWVLSCFTNGVSQTHRLLILMARAKSLSPSHPTDVLILLVDLNTFRPMTMRQFGKGRTTPKRESLDAGPRCWSLKLPTSTVNGSDTLTRTTASLRESTPMTVAKLH